jgi:hypothetical protein
MINFAISKPKYQIKAVKLLILVLIISFPLMGSDCGKAIVGGAPGDLMGKWQLVFMTGYLQDVCSGEVVDYFSNGTVTLQCPGKEQITRSYTVSNDVLTYQPSGLQYNITSLTTTSLVLSGVNVGRTLTYNRLPDDYVVKDNGNSKSINSSEKP